MLIARLLPIPFVLKSANSEEVGLSNILNMPFKQLFWNLLVNVLV